MIKFDSYNVRETYLRYILYTICTMYTVRLHLALF